MSGTLPQTDAAAVLLVLSGLALLGTGNVASGIRLVALQGALLALILLARPGEITTRRSLTLAGGTLALKSGVFPWLLFRAQREAGAHEELHPFVGYQASMAAGVLLLGIAVWLSARLAVPPLAHSLGVTVALFLIFVGLFVLVSRRIAIGQVLGYIVLENGIALFGFTVAVHEPLLIELGVLLDVFVAVFVMGIAIVHINREFDHIEVDRLAALRD
jgi:hydrogenase-4 component E